MEFSKNLSFVVSVLSTMMLRDRMQRSRESDKVFAYTLRHLLFSFALIVDMRHAKITPFMVLRSENSNNT